MCVSDSLLSPHTDRQAIENLATNLQCQRDELVSLSAYFYSFGWKKSKKKSFGHNMEEKLVRLSSLLSRISRVFSPKRITKKGFAKPKRRLLLYKKGNSFNLMKHTNKKRNLFFSCDQMPFPLHGNISYVCTYTCLEKSIPYIHIVVIYHF